MLPSKSMNDHVLSEEATQKLIVYGKGVLVVLLLVALGLAGSAFWKNYQEGTNEKAFSLLFKAEHMEELASRESEGQGGAEVLKIMQSWGPDKKKDFENALITVVKEYPQSTASKVARLKIARWKLASQDLPAARSYYEELRKNLSSSADAIFLTMTLEGLAMTYEVEKKYPEALQYLDEALLVPKNTLKPTILLAKARVLVLSSKNTEAKSVYDTIIREYSGSPYEKKARALMGLHHL